MAEDPHDWEVETRLVRGGMVRSEYGEISEALYLTQSFAYPDAASADARFSGEQPGFIYQRFGNPTTQMFEDRLALLEGAEVCRATASGMAAVQAEWGVIIPTVRDAMARGVDPTSPEILAVARRWMALVNEFTGGDAAIASSVRTMYEHEGPALQEKLGNVPTPEMFPYMAKAFAAL